MPGGNVNNVTRNIVHKVSKDLPKTRLFSDKRNKCSPSILSSVLHIKHFVVTIWICAPLRVSVSAIFQEISFPEVPNCEQIDRGNCKSFVAATIIFVFAFAVKRDDSFFTLGLWHWPEKPMTQVSGDDATTQRKTIRLTTLQRTCVFVYSRISAQSVVVDVFVREFDNILMHSVLRVQEVYRAAASGIFIEELAESVKQRLAKIVICSSLK